MILHQELGAQEAWALRPVDNSADFVTPKPNPWLQCCSETRGTSVHWSIPYRRGNVSPAPPRNDQASAYLPSGGSFLSGGCGLAGTDGFSCGLDSEHEG